MNQILHVASLRNIITGQKTRILRELYEQNEEVDQVSIFSLIACDPVNFDEAVKKDVWIKAMDEEIDSMEINNTWDLVDFLDNTFLFVSNGFIRLS